MITNGKPITLLVASRRMAMPSEPIISSIGKLKLLKILIFKRTPPLSTN